MKNQRINRSRLRLISAFSIVLAAILTFIFLILPSGASDSNRVNENESVKVFVGSSRMADPIGSNIYILGRKSFLSKLADKHPETVYSAVVVLDDYYSVQDIEELAKNENLTINTIYLWAPGETGRAALGVKNNDFKASIARVYNRAKEHEGTEEFNSADEHLIRLIDGNYGIFSITVEATAEKLNKLKSNKCIEFVDVKYSEAGEKKAAKRGVSIYYIELPYKPDGAL